MSKPEGVAAPLEPTTAPQICIDCGHEFGVWFAENPVWNAIIPSRVGMLCPCCFIVRAEKRGFNTTGWKMVPMDHPLGEESIEQVPSPQKFGQAYAQQLNASARQGTVYFIGEHEIKFAEAYAAAVSKKLQEELARTKKDLEIADLDAEHYRVGGNDWAEMSQEWQIRAEKAESRILELEKEIAAIRKVTIFRED